MSIIARGVFPGSSSTKTLLVCFAVADVICLMLRML